MSLKRSLDLLKASGAVEEVRDLSLRSQHVLLLKVLLSSTVKHTLFLTRRRRRRARRGGGGVDTVGLRDSGQAASGKPGWGAAAASGLATAS